MLCLVHEPERLNGVNIPLNGGARIVSVRVIFVLFCFLMERTENNGGQVQQEFGFFNFGKTILT